MYLKILFIIFVSFTYVNAERITFLELTKLASSDLNKTIVIDNLDDTFKDQLIDFTIADNLKRGDMYSYYKVFLFDNNLVLQYNVQGNYYYIEKKPEVVEPVILDEVPLPAYEDTKKYYSYKIKNITNQDVIKVMSIFSDVKYTYLEQSDLIAYSCLPRMHADIRRMLISSDNTVLSKTVKITIFSINRTKLKEYGSNIRAFNMSFDGTFDGIVNAFRNNNRSVFKIQDSFNLGMTLFAMQGHGITKITQEPTVLLTNGIETNIKSVLTVPYIESSTTVDENKKTTTNNIKYKDVGLQIKLKPKIKSNWVYLDMDLVSEELICLQDDKPITQKITYKSVFKVIKGKPLLLTGIRKQSSKFEKDGIPFLSDLPYIGQLFKKRKNQSDKQNINILIEVM